MNKKQYIDLCLFSFSQSGGRIQFNSDLVGSDGTIPDKYSAYHDNIVPSISIGTVSSDIKQLVLLMYDLDAVNVAGKIWIHWFCVLEPKLYETKTGEQMPGAQKNSFGNMNYGGPKPPKGKGSHTYHLALYGLDTVIKFTSNESYETIFDKIQEHIVETHEITGTYGS